MNPVWQIRGRRLSLERPLVMGIVNVTPDSFSDGGRFDRAADAVARAGVLMAEGADILDVGGESTRPQGATRIPVDEELRRVLPVVRGIRDRHPDAILSVDTVKSAVADAALREGASIVNDVSGFRLDPAMARVCADAAAGVVLMHSRGDIETMATYEHAHYAGDPMTELLAELRARVDVALAAGLPETQIAVDPGIGFAKRAAHSLRALGALARLVEWGYPVLVGASRKRFIGELTGVSDPSARVHGSVGAALAAYERGAHLFRVHDVAATRQALDVAAAVRGAGAA